MKVFPDVCNSSDITAALLTLSFQNGLGAEKTDDEVKQAIIKESIASYLGNCPCPFNSASNGSSCGKRSAYSRPGGASPICYEDDVTDAIVEKWKAQHK